MNIWGTSLKPRKLIWFNLVFRFSVTSNRSSFVFLSVASRKNWSTWFTWFWETITATCAGNQETKNETIAWLVSGHERTLFFIHQSTKGNMFIQQNRNLRGKWSNLYSILWIKLFFSNIPNFIIQKYFSGWQTIWQ